MLYQRGSLKSAALASDAKCFSCSTHDVGFVTNSQEQRLSPEPGAAYDVS